MGRHDLPRFRPGQKSVPARKLNALAELAADMDRRPEPYTVRVPQHLIIAQADILSGAKGSVKYGYWNDETSSFETQGAAFDAVNIGPGAIPAGGRALLAVGERAIPMFAYSAGDDTDVVSSSSSISSTSDSSYSSTSGSSESSSQSESESSVSTAETSSESSTSSSSTEDDILDYYNATPAYLEDASGGTPGSTFKVARGDHAHPSTITGAANWEEPGANAGKIYAVWK